jgi:transcriptional regulator with XRE-family HTH domain
MTVPIIAVTSSLEDLRQMHYETKVEFARRIGVTVQTYDRMLKRDPNIQGPTKRRVAERLKVPPHMIAEFAISPSPERLAAIGEIIEEANRNRSWYRLNEDGTVTHDPEAYCPPGDSSES